MPLGKVWFYSSSQCFACKGLPANLETTIMLQNALTAVPDCVEGVRLIDDLIRADKAPNPLDCLRSAIARRPNSAVTNMYLGSALCKEAAFGEGMLLLKRDACRRQG